MTNDPDLLFVVTGATGWIGRASLEWLNAALGDGFRQRVFAYGSCYSEIVLQSGMRVPVVPLDRLRDLPPGRYCFLHYAFLTKDRVAGLPLIEYVRRNREISDCVAQAADQLSPAGFFLPSSGAVYRADRSLDRDLERNPYGALKVEDEERFGRLAARLHCPMLVVRLFNLAGPYINKIGNYALASILADIIAGRPVMLKACHPVLRSYVDIGDLLDLVFDCLLHPRGGDRAVFDTAGETVVEVGELARLALQVMGRPDLAILRPEMAPDEPEDRYVGDGAALAAMAASHGITFRPLAKQIVSTADYLERQGLYVS